MGKLIAVLIFVLFGCSKKVIYDYIYCSAYSPVKNYGYLKESDKDLYKQIKLNNLTYESVCLNDGKLYQTDKKQ